MLEQHDMRLSTSCGTVQPCVIHTEHIKSRPAQDIAEACVHNTTSQMNDALFDMCGWIMHNVVPRCKT